MLYEMTKGKKAETLSEDQVEELKSGYAGSQYTLQAYETGGFSGIPKNIPPGIIWQDSEFHFSTYLQVLAEVQKK